MKKFYNKYVLDTKYIFGIYIVTSILSALSKYNLGPKAYNNYLIFKNVFFNALKQQNLYSEYPKSYFDMNHYGIFFSILVAPFAVLPDWLGMPLWNVANAVVLLYAFNKLPFSKPKIALLSWLCLQEYITAAVSLQFNVALTGLIILSAVYIYRQEEAKSAFAILIGFFVKLYGIVGLSSFFFVKNKVKFIAILVIGFFLFLALPMIISGYKFGLNSYADWFHSLQQKNISNQVLGNRQDFSLMGIVRRVLQNADISNLYFLIPGVAVFALPYLRIRQYKYLPFQLLILCSTLLFIVLFSSSSESPTYIIAVAGVMIWFLIQKERNFVVISLMIFTLWLTCFGSSDLFPKYVKDNFVIKYSLKALPCCLVWFRIIYELLTKNFERDYNLE